MENPTPFVLTIDFRGWTSASLKALQHLAQKHGIKPVYLATWESLQEASVAAFLAEVVEKAQGEVGILLDNVTTPGANLDERVTFLAEAVERLTGRKPLAHRAADWCVDEPTFAALAKAGLKTDFTVTPHVQWRPGVDYTSYSEKSYITPQGILEIPVTVRTIKQHEFVMDLRKAPGILGKGVNFFFPTVQWLELDGCAVGPVIRLAHRCRREESAFVQLTVTAQGLKHGPQAAVRQLAWFLGRTSSWWQSVTSVDLVRSFQHQALKNNI
jgi:hypothetical protein